MPAFSLTAPQYTNEDETREKASVTKEEETHIRNDLFGRPKEARAAIVPEDEADDLIQKLQDALKEIPEDQKEDAMKAMTEYPNLIDTEAKLIYFLRTVDFDPEVSSILWLGHGVLCTMSHMFVLSLSTTSSAHVKCSCQMLFFFFTESSNSILQVLGI
jgi:hypothetical protein